MWLGLIVFISAWMFLLGVIVGRGTAPVRFDIEKFQKDLAELKEAVLKNEKTRYKVNTQKTEEADLGFYEKLKDPGKQIESVRTPLPETASGQNQTSLEKTPKTIRVEKKATAEPTQQSKETRRPVEKTDTQPAGRFEIQVAALKDAGIADQMVNQLKKKGYPSYRTERNIPGKGTWYRVRVGVFKQQKEVEAALLRLKKDGFEAILLK